MQFPRPGSSPPTGWPRCLFRKGRRLRKVNSWLAWKAKRSATILPARWMALWVGYTPYRGKLSIPRRFCAIFAASLPFWQHNPAHWAWFQAPCPFDPSALIIFGGGGHGKTVIDLVRAAGNYRIVGVIDDGLPAGSEVLDVPVLGGSKDLKERPEPRRSPGGQCSGWDWRCSGSLENIRYLSQSRVFLPGAVYPSAVVERSAVLEAGVQVFAQAYVGSAARVGFGTVINTAAIVHHDCVIGRVVNLIARRDTGRQRAGRRSCPNWHARHRQFTGYRWRGGAARQRLYGQSRCPRGRGCAAGTIWPMPISAAGN